MRSPPLKDQVERFTLGNWAAARLANTRLNAQYFGWKAPHLNAVSGLSVFGDAF